jgi:hypothetical protein
MNGSGAEGDAAPFSYYSERLAGERLRRVYEVASPRVKRYFAEEIRHVVSRLPAAASVLGSAVRSGGAGSRACGAVVGVDTALEPRPARRFRGGGRLAVTMDAVGSASAGPSASSACRTASAFHVDRRRSSGGGRPRGPRRVSSRPTPGVLAAPAGVVSGRRPRSGRADRRGRPGRRHRLQGRIHRDHGPPGSSRTSRPARTASTARSTVQRVLRDRGLTPSLRQPSAPRNAPAVASG